MRYNVMKLLEGYPLDFDTIGQFERLMIMSKTPPQRCGSEIT